MKVLVLYRRNSEYGRDVDSFIRDFKVQHEANASLMEVLDIDTRDGVATASLYDVMEYPAVLVLADDGSLIKSWVGASLPMMDELASYVYSP